MSSIFFSNFTRAFYIPINLPLTFSYLGLARADFLDWRLH